MSEDITCPAPLDMLRRGSPVVDFAHSQQRGTVRVATDGTMSVSDYNGWLLTEDMNTVEMDLTDPTGRAHAAWWVAKQLDPEARERADWHFFDGEWWLTRRECDGTAASGWPGRAWVFTAWEGHRRIRRGEDVYVSGLREIVKAMELNDVLERKLLPDGSRVVDALALKAVVEHLIAQMEKTS